MKPILILAASIAVLSSCKKEDPETCTDGIKNQEEVYADCGGPCSPCPITYPENGMVGLNVLHGDEDTLNLVASNYGFKASVPLGSDLKVVASTLTGSYWFYGTNNGWEIGTPTNSQTFEVANPGTADLVFNLTGTSGSALLEFYENNTSVTKQKVIIWD